MIRWSGRNRFIRPWWMLVWFLLAAACIGVRIATDPLLFRDAPEGYLALLHDSAEGPGTVGQADGVLTGSELYAKYCRTCHGDDGDGRGPAARYLNPKPRDLRTESFRLVSTENRVPSEADVAAVLANGIPGTSMRSYQDLNEGVRQKLVDEVFRLRRSGMREYIVKLLREELFDENPSDEEVQEILELRLTPGLAVAVPTFASSSPAALARGRELFVKSGCVGCHGDSGTGDTALHLEDESGWPIRPRNFVAGEFKGGRDPEGVYRRILLGIPGTPMPSSAVLTDQQRMDLVHYCLSLCRQPVTPSTNYARVLATISQGSMDLSTTATTR